MRLVWSSLAKMRQCSRWTNGTPGYTLANPSLELLGMLLIWKIDFIPVCEGITPDFGDKNAVRPNLPVRA